MINQPKAGDLIQVRDVLWTCKLIDLGMDAGEWKPRFWFEAFLVVGVGAKRITYQRYDAKTQQAGHQTHMELRRAVTMARSRREAANRVLKGLKDKTVWAREEVVAADKEYAWAIKNIDLVTEQAERASVGADPDCNGDVA